MRRARSIERTWTYLRHEFHGGALPGSGADRPRPPELESKLGFRNSIKRILWCTPCAVTVLPVLCDKEWKRLEEVPVGGCRHSR